MNGSTHLPPSSSTRARLLGPLWLALLGLSASASTGAVGAAGGQSDGGAAGDPNTPQSSVTDPSAGFNGDDVGTLPAVDGGWSGGVWSLGGSLGSAQHDDGPEAGGADAQPGEVPTLALVGPDYAVAAAVLDAGGDGFVVRESLGAGQVRLSFHGDVRVLLSTAWVGSGAVEVQLLVPAEFAPARAAVQWMSRWTAPIGLVPGQEIEVPDRILRRGVLEHTGGLEVQALSTLGVGYRLRLAESDAGLALVQEALPPL